MSRIFSSPGEVKTWFAENHRLDENMLGQRLQSAADRPGPEWTRLTARFSVRLYRGVWEVQGIRLR